jgi:hypothetical protein
VELVNDLAGTYLPCPSFMEIIRTISDMKLHSRYFSKKGSRTGILERQNTFQTNNNYKNVRDLCLGIN